MTTRCMVLDLDGTLTASGTAQPIPGMPEVLAALHARGVVLAVATSMPATGARRVLAALGVAELVSSVAGRPPNGMLAGKDDIVAEALLGLGGAPEGTVLVGDTVGDVHAALAHGLDPVGVAWGATPGPALLAAGARTVLADPTDLLAL